MGRTKGGKNRYYTKEFKLQIIEELKTGESTYSISQKHNIHRSVITRWLSQYKEGGESALEPKRKPGNPFGGLYKKKFPSEIEQLRYELAKAEVEIIKLKKRLEIQRREESQKK